VLLLTVRRRIPDGVLVCRSSQRGISSSQAATEVEVNLRPTVSRPVCLGIRHPSGTRDQFFFLHEISLRQLWLYFVAPSLMRGRVCNCTIAFRPCQSSHSWVEVPQNSRPYFTVSSETPSTWRARSPYLYPPGTGWPSYTPGAVGSLFVASYGSQGYGGGILTRLHTGYTVSRSTYIYKFSSYLTGSTILLRSVF
jgi:hypothetical protein